MRKIVFFTLLIGYTSIAYSADFRKVDWGMSVDEVKKHENAKYIRDGFGPDKKHYWLSYEVVLDNHTYELRYVFSHDGKLESASYTKTFSISENDCGQVITRFSNSISNKYGKPTFSSVNPDLDEESATCKTMIERKYSRISNWKSKNRVTLIAGSGDSDSELTFVVIAAPFGSTDITDNI